MRKGRFLAVAISTSAACSGDKKGRIRATRRFPFRIHMICMKWSSLGLPRRGEKRRSSVGSVLGNAECSTAGPAPGREHTRLKKTALGRKKKKNNGGTTPLTLTSACLMGWAGGQGSVPHGTAEKEPPRPCVLPCPSALRRLRIRQEARDLKRGTQRRGEAQSSGRTDSQRARRRALFAAPGAAGMEVVIGS